jgi:hypothetical protein
MLNTAPIFVNGFQYGGTNILINLIASHPDVGLSRVETHEVFYGREREQIWKWVSRFFYLPILGLTRQHIFWPYNLDDRRTPPRIVWPYIDLLLFLNKLVASDNRSLGYEMDTTIKKIAGARLLSKNVNGLALTTALFDRMYPQATFVALVRNGFALCEGFMRRGWSVERFGRLYHRVGQAMLNDVENRENYMLVRFEDMLADPVGELENICRHAHLDFDRIRRVRLQAKASMNQSGERKRTFGSTNREVQWFPPDQVRSRFRQDVNENQIARLSEEEKKQFLTFTRPLMERFGYIGDD